MEYRKESVFGIGRCGCVCMCVCACVQWQEQEEGGKLIINTIAHEQGTHTSSIIEVEKRAVAGAIEWAVR